MEQTKAGRSKLGAWWWKMRLRLASRFLNGTGVTMIREADLNQLASATGANGEYVMKSGHINNGTRRGKKCRRKLGDWTALMLAAVTPYVLLNVEKGEDAK